MAERIFFDTNPVIYYLDAHSLYASKVYWFLVHNKMRGAEFYTSTITNAEFFCKPMANLDFDKIEAYDRFIQDFRFTVLPITESIAWRSAQLRAKYKGLKLPDALQLAAAMDQHCDSFLTNDERLIQVSEANVLYLSTLRND